MKVRICYLGGLFAVSGDLRFLDYFFFLQSNLFTAILLSFSTFSIRKHLQLCFNLGIGYYAIVHCNTLQDRGMIFVKFDYGQITFI